MFSVSKDSIEDTERQWKANWETDLIDYISTPSVTDWTRTFVLEEGKTFEGHSFPLPLTPKENEISLESTLEHLSHSQEWLNKALIKHGAVLFRGFPIKSPADFDVVVKSVGFENFKHIGGAAVRHSVVGNVFTASDFPPEKSLCFHHEVSYSPNHPKHLFFYCEVPAKEGGETPICLSWLIYERCLERLPLFTQKLEEKGLKQVRYLPEEDDLTSPIGRGWKSAFLTNDKEEAERKCTQAGNTFEWVEMDGKKNIMKTIYPTLPAIRFDKRSGKKCFFNNVAFGLTSIFGKQGSVLFGDDSPIPTDQIEKVLGIMDELKVAFKWKAGDVLVVDNKLTMHARNSFVPPREVFASLTY